MRNVLLACLMIIVAGCSTPKQFKGVAIGDSITLISAVPPLLQTKKVSCGPTCLAAVASYWGRDFNALLDGRTLSDDFNADQLAEMGGFIGLKVFGYKGSMGDLETNLIKGRPLIVLIPKPKFEDGAFTFSINGVPLNEIMMLIEPKQSHWIVVVGCTEFRIIVQDPAWGRIALPRWKFEEWWNSKKNTCLLAVPVS